MKSLLYRVWLEIYYATLLFKIGGPWVFLKQFGRQIYSQDAQVGLELNLQEAKIPIVEAKIAYSLRLASKEDMDEILQLAKSESKDMAQKLIYRRLLYEDGYHNCYIARTIDTNEICSMLFTIFPEDDKVVKGIFRNWFPRLKEGEALIEGTYTFEKFRGNRLHPAITTDQFRICKEKGVQRMIGYVQKNNIASLKGNQRAGYMPFEEVPELKIMFFTFRKYNRVRQG